MSQALAAFRPGSTGVRRVSSLRRQTTPAGLASGYTWYYTIRDEANRPSIEYHLASDGTTIVPDRFFVYLGNLLAATYEFGSGQWLYYSEDHLGSVRMITNAEGTPLCQSSYMPYGYELPGGCGTVLASTSAPTKFAGMEWDSSSGIDYDHARYMASLGGRFLSADKLEGRAADPQSWNRYAYGDNNPVTRLDMNGLKAFTFVYQVIQVINRNEVRGSTGGLLGAYQLVNLKTFGSNTITNPFNPEQQVASGEFKTFNRLVVHGDVTNGVVTLDQHAFNGSAANLGETHVGSVDVAGTPISKTGPAATTLSTDINGQPHTVQVEQSISGAINGAVAVAGGAKEPLTIGSTISLTITGEGDEPKVTPTATYSLFPTTYTCSGNNDQCEEHIAYPLNEVLPK